MAQDTYTLLFSEILTKVNNAKDKPKKIAVLKKYDCDTLRMVIKSSFDPKIKWMLPQGAVPFIKNESPAGEEHTILRKEAKKLYHFLQGGDDKLPQFKRENLFIQMLEGLHGDEAELLINAKDKKLHQIYKGLSDAVVKEAFGWDENYLKKT